MHWTLSCTYHLPHRLFFSLIFLFLFFPTICSRVSFVLMTVMSLGLYISACQCVAFSKDRFSIGLVSAAMLSIILELLVQYL